MLICPQSPPPKEKETCLHVVLRDAGLSIHFKATIRAFAAVRDSDHSSGSDDDSDPTSGYSPISSASSSDSDEEAPVLPGLKRQFYNLKYIGSPKMSCCTRIGL